MLLFAPVKKVVVENKVLWKYNLISIPLDIPELWMKVTASFAKDTIDDPLTTWNTELIDLCWKYVEKNDIVLNWEKVWKFLLADIISEISLSAFDCWRNVLKFDYEMPEDSLSKLKSENREILTEIKKINNIKKKWIKKEVTNDDILNAILSIRTKNMPSESLSQVTKWIQNIETNQEKVIETSIWTVKIWKWERKRATLSI